MIERGVYLRMVIAAIILVMCCAHVYVPVTSGEEGDASRFIIVDRLTDHHYIPGTVNQTQMGPPTGGENLHESSAIEDLAFSFDNKWLASASRDASIIIWDTNTWESIHTIRHENGNMMYSVAFSPDGKWLASTAYMDEDVCIWNTTDWSLETRLSGRRFYMKDVEFSPDGSVLASASRDLSIDIWYTSNWTLKKTLQGHFAVPQEITFSADNNYFAACDGGGSIHIWSTHNWTHIKTLLGHLSTTFTISFSGDSAFLASGSADKTVRVWQISDWTEIALISHSDYTIASMFPNSNWLISASVDGTMAVYETSNWKFNTLLETNSKSIECLAVSPNNNWLAVGTDEVTIYGNAPDLSVSKSDISFSSTTINEGDNVTISARIFNKGLVDAYNVPVHIYDEKKLIGNITVDIPAGDNEIILIESTIEGLGRHDIWIVIDEDFKIFEENEENNQASLDFVINEYALYFTTEDISFSNDNITKGTKLTISANIHNIGEKDVTDIEISFSDESQLIGSDSITVVKDGVGKAEITWVTPNETGPKYLFIWIDKDNTLMEKDRTNNFLIYKIWVGDEENYQPPEIPEDSDDDGIMDEDDAFPNTKYLYSYWQIVIPMIIMIITGMYLYSTMSPSRLKTGGNL